MFGFNIPGWVYTGGKVGGIVLLLYLCYAIYNVRRHVKKGEKEKHDARLN